MVNGNTGIMDIGIVNTSLLNQLKKLKTMERLNQLTDSEVQTIETQIYDVEAEMAETDDMILKFELADELMKLKKKIGIVKPPDSPYECEGCGA